MWWMVLALTVGSFGDAGMLAADDFDVRQRATARLAWRREAAVPALALAAFSDDLEQRLRARRVLARTGEPYRQVADLALACCLFYGPDESPQFRESGRYLGKSERFVGHLPVEQHLRLGLLGAGEAALVESDHSYYGRVGWVNVMRFRARGLKDPPGP